jgi:hypothetical protein
MLQDGSMPSAVFANYVSSLYQAKLDYVRKNWNPVAVAVVNITNSGFRSLMRNGVSSFDTGLQAYIKGKKNPEATNL